MLITYHTKTGAYSTKEVCTSHLYMGEEDDLGTIYIADDNIEVLDVDEIEEFTVFTETEPSKEFDQYMKDVRESPLGKYLDEESFTYTFDFKTPCELAISVIGAIRPLDEEKTWLEEYSKLPRGLSFYEKVFLLQVYNSRKQTYGWESPMHHPFPNYAIDSFSPYDLGWFKTAIIPKIGEFLSYLEGEEWCYYNSDAFNFNRAKTFKHFFKIEEAK